MKAMSKRFKSRYSNADDFARALRGVLSRSSRLCTDVPVWFEGP